jgi:hypothetical protein
MAYQMTREARYLKRAEELRTIADSLTDPGARKTLLDIAAEYDQLALSARHLPEPNRPSSDP